MVAVAMYDGVTPSNIPADAPAVAGYVNSFPGYESFIWKPSDWARFPRAFKKSISVRADQPADILDVEQGDASPSQAPGWVRLAQRYGIPVPTLYCSRLGTWPATLQACRGLACTYWVADQTDSPHLVPGSVATQWTDFRNLYDVSVADLAWLSGDPVTPPTMLNAPIVAIMTTKSGQGYWLVGADGGVFSYGDAVFYGSLGGKPVDGVICDATTTPTEAGYWLVSDRGAVYTFGDAQYKGGANVR